MALAVALQRPMRSGEIVMVRFLGTVEQLNREDEMSIFQPRPSHPELWTFKLQRKDAPQLQLSDLCTVPPRSNGKSDSSPGP